MKFNCGETYSEKIERLSEWHKWFAWYPVRVGSHDCRWLEYVERKGYFLGVMFFDDGVCWEYRSIK